MYSTMFNRVCDGRTRPIKGECWGKLSWLFLNIELTNGDHTLNQQLTITDNSHIKWQAYFCNNSLKMSCRKGTSTHTLKYYWVMGCACCTAVEHTPAEQYTWGRGFDSRMERAIFLLFLSLSSVFSIRSLKEVQHNWFFITKNNN